MDAKLEQKAREILAGEFQDSGEHGIASDLRTGVNLGGFPGIALRATTRALQAQPAEGGVVPIGVVSASGFAELDWKGFAVLRPNRVHESEVTVYAAAPKPATTTGEGVGS